MPESCSAAPKTALYHSENTADDLKEKLNEFQEKAEEATDFLLVDYAQAENQLARNWGWIAVSGISTMILGALALLLPVFATGVTYNGIVFTIGISGDGGVAGAITRENGHRAKSALSGLFYVALAYYMFTHVALGLDIVTLTIAAVIGAEGLYETIFAVKNKEMKRRRWHLASGIGSTLVGLWLSTSIPASSLVTPGIALGARLTGNGATKVAVGLTGKELAGNRKTENRKK